MFRATNERERGKSGRVDGLAKDGWMDAFWTRQPAVFLTLSPTDERRNFFWSQLVSINLVTVK